MGEGEALVKYTAVELIRDRKHKKSGKTALFES